MFPFWRVIVNNISIVVLFRKTLIYLEGEKFFQLPSRNYLLFIWIGRRQLQLYSPPGVTIISQNPEDEMKTVILAGSGVGLWRRQRVS